MLRRAWPRCCGRGLVTLRAEHVVVIGQLCSRWRLAHLRLSQRATGVRMERTPCRSFGAHTIPRGVRAASFLDWPLVYSLQRWGIYVRTVVSWCTTLASVWATVSHPPPDNDCVLACMVHVWPFFPVLLVVGSILHCRLCCDGGFERRWRRGRRTCSILVRGREDGVRCARLESTCACGGWIGCPVVKVLGDKEAQDGNLAARDTSDDINSVRAAGAHQALQIIGRFTYCCLPNFGRCGLSQDRLSVNCPLVEQLYPAEWMAEKLFRTVDHPS